MAWLFRRAPSGTEADDREEQERRAAALVTMRDLCKDLLESPQDSAVGAEQGEAPDDDNDFVAAARLEVPDECTFLRFLNGYGHDAHVASNRLRRMLRWRASHSYGLTDVLVRDINETTPGVEKQIQTGKCYILSKSDKMGRPIIVVHVRRHDPNMQSRDDLTRFGVHILERGSERLAEAGEAARAGADKEAEAAAATASSEFCIIFNLEGIALSNIDLNAAKRIIYMLTNFYPERMGVCLMVGAPMIFSAAWQVIRPWLAPKSQEKVKFCNSSALSTWIDAHALPVYWGGEDATAYTPR